MQRKKTVSPTVPVQSIIPRELYAELVKICAENDYTIKETIQFLIEEFIKHDKLLHRKWEITDEQWNKAMDSYESYTAIRDRDNLQEKEKK